MDNAKLLAAMFAGAVLAVGSEHAVDAISDATAAERVPFVHAADLRRRPGEADVTVTAYATVEREGAARRDIGEAAKCDVTEPQAQIVLTTCLQLLAKTCSWEPSK